jgi:hypothetical protein
MLPPSSGSYTMFKLEIEIVNCWQACNDHIPTPRKPNAQAYSNITYIYLDALKTTVLLEKLSGSRLVKNFPAFYKT